MIKLTPIYLYVPTEMSKLLVVIAQAGITEPRTLALNKVPRIEFWVSV